MKDLEGTLARVDGSIKSNMKAINKNQEAFDQTGQQVKDYELKMQNTVAQVQAMNKELEGVASELRNLSAPLASLK